MTFMVYGLGGHELMPLKRLFRPGVADKTRATSPVHGINREGNHDEPREYQQQGIAEQAYRAIEHLSQDNPVLFAHQIMTSPVVTLTPQSAVIEALKLFQARQFRHVPVVSSEGFLVGMISDRDILRHIGGLTKHYEEQKGLHDTNDLIERLMQTHVLTASVDTDVRYIARLFVEQRIGAMPIVKDGELIGIITRSDILRAVMRHFVLELWA